MKNKSFINIQNVSFSYDEDNTNTKNIIDDISLNINEGEFISLLGHNASGKSTIAKLLVAMVTPNKGKITVDGLDTCDEDNKYEIKKKVGLILQNPENQIIAGVVEEDVAFGPENLGVPSQEIKQRVFSALKDVDMYEHRKKSPHKLSGGQKQRVAIAGIIAMRQKCIVLDEPTSMLDPIGRDEVMKVINKLNKEKGITIILITHNMDEAVQADRTIILQNGKIAKDDTPKEVFSNIKIMKDYKLDIPQATGVIEGLKEKGAPLEGTALNVEECVKMLKPILKK